MLASSSGRVGVQPRTSLSQCARPGSWLSQPSSTPCTSATREEGLGVDGCSSSAPQQQRHRRSLACSAASPSPGSGAGGSFSRRGARSERKARAPGLFEVKVITPPPRSLGIYALPPNTHNGEQIEIEGEAYVVTSLVLRYKLVRGRYVRDHNQLDVQPTGRYFLNMMLDNLVKARYIGPTGTQD